MLSPNSRARASGKKCGRSLLLTLIWGGLLTVVLSGLSPLVPSAHVLAQPISSTGDPTKTGQPGGTPSLTPIASSTAVKQAISLPPITKTPVVGPVIPPGSFSPQYNQVWGIGSHNSYWFNRGDTADIAASGAQEVLSDQLLHEHIRAIELDIHSEGADAHTWKIYHTSNSEDFSCSSLADCLQMLQMFQFAMPYHDVFNVILELKNVAPIDGSRPIAPSFDANHTMDDLDNQIRSALGPYLYTPGNFLSQCPGIVVMTDCMRSQGWPTIDALRGKFIFNIIGNWGQNASDWADYATSNIANRVAFPVFSFLAVANPGEATQAVKLPNGPLVRDWALPPDLPLGIGNLLLHPVPVEADEHFRAFNQSIFWQFEPFKEQDQSKITQQSSALHDFLAANGVVRSGDSFSRADQTSRMNLGIQILQTDYPWNAIGMDSTISGLPVDTTQRLHMLPPGLPNSPGPPFRALPETGNRIYFDTQDFIDLNDNPIPYKVFTYDQRPATGTYWLETTVSTTRRGDPWERCPAFPGDPANTGSCDQPGFPRIANDDPGPAGEGCVRAESDNGQEWIELCRQKEDTSLPGDNVPNQEHVNLVVHIVHKGVQQATFTFTADRGFSCAKPPLTQQGTPCVGNSIAMLVSDDPTAGANSAFVKLYTAYNATNSTPPALSQPQWQLLASVQQNFPVPLTRIGLSGSRDELFVGTNLGSSVNPGFPLNCGTPELLSNMPGRERAFGDSTFTITNQEAGMPVAGAPPCS